MTRLFTKTAAGDTYELDINADEPIAMSKKFIDLSDVTIRRGDFTRSFDLPRTNRNNLFFGLFGDMSSIGVSWTPRFLAPCWIIEESNIVIEGILKLESTDSKNSKYSVSVSGTIALIKDAIGEKMMSDLDMAAWKYLVTDIYDTWDASFASGHMIFSLFDNGVGMGLYKKKDTGNVIINVTEYTCTDGILLDTTLPAFRLNELLRKMFNESGYEVDGSWFAEDECEKIYVQSDNPLSSNFETLVNWSTQPASDLALTSSYQTVPLKAASIVGDFDNTTHEYTAPVAGDYTFQLRADITEGDPTTTVVTFELQNGGVGFTTLAFPWNKSGTKTYTETLAAGDTVRVQVKTDGTEVNPGYIMATDAVHLSMTGMIPSSAYIDPSAHLSNYKQIDFLREVIGIFNLIVWVNKENEVQIDTWDYYMANYGTKKDWSDKVDLTKTPVVKPINAELRNPINLELKRASDILNAEYIKVTGRSYGSYREDTQLPFTKPPQAPFRVFAPAPLQGVNSDVSAAENLELIVAKLYASEDDITFRPPGLQLLYYNGERTLSGTEYLYTKDDASASCVRRYAYPYFSPFRLYSADSWQVQSDTLDLNFAWFTPPEDIVDAPAEENIYKRYFREMLRDRYDEANKIIEFYAILTPVDIANFTFSDTITIKLNGTAVGLRILEINDYSINKVASTKVKAMITFIK